MKMSEDSDQKDAFIGNKLQRQKLSSTFIDKN